MSDSNTSIIEPNYLGKNNENLLNNDKKNISTDTDFYFNMIANPIKIVENKKHSESSDINDIINSESDTKISSKSNSKSSSSKSTSSQSKNKNSDSKLKIENISIKNNLDQLSKPIQQQQYTQPPQVQYVQPSQSQYVQPHQLHQPQAPQPQYVQHHQLHQHQTPQQQYVQQPNIQQPQAPQQQNIQQPQFTKPTINQLINMENNTLSSQEIKLKKIELLRKLCEIKSKGYQLSKEYDFTSSLEEMEYEYELLKSFVDKRNGIRVYKNILLQATSVLEFLNDKYDPFDFHLSGWSEHVSVESDNWDDLWEEIYEKYKGKGRKMAIEIKLLYLIVVSASAFHFSKAHTSKLLGLDSLLSSNPGLLSKIINPSNKEESKFMTQQEINIEKQKEELKKKEMESKMNKQKKESTDYKFPMHIPIKESESKINISKPDKVNDILNKIHNLQGKKISNDDTQDEATSNDRLLSESTISETNKNSKNKGRKTKKSSISIL